MLRRIIWGKCLFLVINFDQTNNWPTSLINKIFRVNTAVAQLKTRVQGIFSDTIFRSQNWFLFCSVNMSSSEINPEDVDMIKYRRKISLRHRLTRWEKILLVLLILVLAIFVIVLFAILASTDAFRRPSSEISEKGECLLFRSSCCEFNFTLFW